MPLPASTPSTSLSGGSTTQAMPGSGLSLHVGLESIFEYNGILLNDRRVEDKYKLNRVAGFEDADIRDTRENMPQRHGERALNAFYAGRTITLTGQIRAGTLAKLRDMQQALRGAFSDISTERPLKIYSTDWASAGTTPDVQISCKKHQSMTTDEAQATAYFYRDFAVILRASNPNIVSQTQKQDAWTATGASVSSNILNLDNDGNYPSDPLIRIQGPALNPLITNTTNGQVLRFKSNISIPAGVYWDVNIAAGTIIASNGTNQFNNLDITSDWPVLSAGQNAITYQASSLTAGTSYVAVYWRDTWW